METARIEVLPGVMLTALKTAKFKTGCLSLNLLTQLQRETASMNAVIPYVLRRGSRFHPDMQAIAEELDAQYGSCIEPVVRRIGEIQCVGFYASFPDEKFLPQGESVLSDCAGLMGEILLNPNTKGGLLLPEYVESEKDKLLELIRSRINNKRGYAASRLIEEMCCFEDFSVPRFGTEDTAEGIYYRKLTKHYRKLLAESPVEIFYCGSADAELVAGILRDALSGMPRGELNYDIGTDIRMNAVEDEVRFFREQLAVTQGKLVMGYRLGECMDEPDIAAIYVFNAVFGSGVTSKLFMNVREKLSLAYYASSIVDTHKGIMLVSSGIDFNNLDAARNEICFQLDAVRKGDITEEEFSSAKAGVAGELRASMDSQGDLEGFYLANALDGLDFDPMELAELVDSVSMDDVVNIANSVVCDAIYFLEGNGEAEENDDEA